MTITTNSEKIQKPMNTQLNEKRQCTMNFQQSMYDVCIPCDTKEALELNEVNGNDNQRQAITSTTSGDGHSITSTTYPTTISSSMHVLGMMPPTHQPLPREKMYMLLLSSKISPLLRYPTKHSSLKT